MADDDFMQKIIQLKMNVGVNFDSVADKIFNPVILDS